MKHILIPACLLCASTIQAQRWQVEVLTGVSGYAGDLTQNPLQLKLLRPALNANIKYRLNNFMYLRAGAAAGQVKGYDKYNSDFFLLMRNLSFESNLLEGNFGVEVDLLPSDLFESYPYVFAGVGLFHFDPYAYDRDNNKIALRPLSTEGQGFPEFPDREKYKLTQFCIPFGGGVKVRLGPAWDLCAELGFRRLFTDYLDDVSTTYVEPAVLLDHIGPKSVEMSYRGKEVGSPLFDPYPTTGDQRGNPQKNDWYYFGGIKLIWRAGDHNSSPAEGRKYKPRPPLKPFKRRQ